MFMRFFIFLFVFFFVWSSCYVQAVLKFAKLNTAAQQREAVAQGRSLPPIPASVSAEEVPARSVDEFLFYYQHFLQANPFPIERKPKNDEEKQKNILNHQRASILYNKLSETAGVLARTANLPDSASKDIKKKRENIIPNTWNLYKNIPTNSTDLWAESCFLKYQSLVHDAELDSGKIKTLHEFAAEIEQYAVLDSLFQHLKRNACLRSLNRVRRPMKDREEDAQQKLPDISEAEEYLVSANRLFADFLKKYPNEENMKIAEIFLDTVNLFRANFPKSNRLPETVDMLRTIFVDVQKRIDEPVVKEYAEVYVGTLRRQEILGKPMPIWGADVSGKILDEKSLDGKIVLLDFWATWCSPCVGEFPQLKKLYEKYHQKGFEIIGYSVDADVKKLTAYLEQKPLPWKILSKETTKQAGLPSLSGYYGAKQVPVVLLRDRSGNVILLDARGEKLVETLEKLFEK